MLKASLITPTDVIGKYAANFCHLCMILSIACVFARAHHPRLVMLISVTSILLTVRTFDKEVNEHEAVSSILSG